MEKNSRKGLLILTIILSLLVVGLSSYLIYDKMIAKDDNEVVDNNEKTNIEFELLDLNQLGRYKNNDGTYGIMETLSYELSTSSFAINLTIDGSIYIHNNKTGENKKINIENVLDIEKFSNAPDGDSYCYILTNSGDVYYYFLSNSLVNDYNVTKVTGVSSVKRLININYCTQGCGWVLFAIKNNNEYIQLGAGSV